MPGELIIDSAFPGGNIIVEKIEGDTAFIRQDLRDTEGDWFYWCFRVRGAAGRSVRFQFTGSNVIGLAGPAVCIGDRCGESGENWSWMGRSGVDGTGFSFSFPPDAREVRFCMGIPYLEHDLRRFLAGRPGIQQSVLCKSRKGRSVELLRLGRLQGAPDHRVLLACRHHCCEMMASYELEGLMDAVLASDDDGAWLREHVEFLVVPFADKDGVEDGDQGKNRRPRDHNRDYINDSVYPEPAALRRLVPEWSAGRLRLSMDLHCPYIRGGVHNEEIYFVGGPEPNEWQTVLRFASMLQEVRRGPLPYDAANSLPFGQGWNTNANFDGGRSFSRWAATLPGMQFASSLELPYAMAGGVTVTPETARAFGADLARATRVFLAEC